MQQRTRLVAAFGETLRQHRLAAGLSQEAAELHRNYVGMIERGTSSPSLGAITAIANALGVRASDFIREARAENLATIQAWPGGVVSRDAGR
jgi:transcriptional regulator with XRE-family HTH domain